MSLRSVLNVAWVLACEGLEPDGIEELEEWLHSRQPTVEEKAEEERKKKARENRAAIADLSRAFALGG